MGLSKAKIFLHRVLFILFCIHKMWKMVEGNFDKEVQLYGTVRQVAAAVYIIYDLCKYMKLTFVLAVVVITGATIAAVSK